VLDALAQQDGAALLGVADEMAARSLSYNAALQDLGTLLHQIALAQTVPAALSDDLPQREDIVRLAQQCDAEQVQLFYQIAVHGRNELGLAPDEYAGFSMTLLRMLAFRPLSTGSDSAPPPASGRQAATPSMPAARPVAPAALLSAAPQAAVTSAPVARAAMNNNAPAAAAAPLSPAMAALAAARAGSSGRSGAAGGASRAPQPVSKPAAAREEARETVSAAAASSAPPPWDQEAPPWDHEAMSLPARVKAVPASAPTPAAVAEPVIPEAAYAPADPAAEKNIARIAADLGWDGNWPSLAVALPLRGVAHQLASHSQLLRCDDGMGNAVVFYFRIPYDNLCAAGSVDKLGAALTERFGRTAKVEVEIGPVQLTAANLAQAEQKARQQAAEQKVQADPFLQSLAREFGTTVPPESIRPV
jgi:DNA polymerase-3 subunit gamma/tau